MVKWNVKHRSHLQPSGHLPSFIDLIWDFTNRAPLNIYWILNFNNLLNIITMSEVNLREAVQKGCQHEFSGSTILPNPVKRSWIFPDWFINTKLTQFTIMTEHMYCISVKVSVHQQVLQPSRTLHISWRRWTTRTRTRVMLNQTRPQGCVLVLLTSALGCGGGSFILHGLPLSLPGRCSRLLSQISWLMYEMQQPCLITVFLTSTGKKTTTLLHDCTMSASHSQNR